MKRGSVLQRVVALFCVGLMAGGCYGPFNLTRRLHQWNGQVGGRWANEVVFLVFAWLPVYSLSTLGDVLIFNSIEFWTGNNPVSPPMTAGEPRSVTKTIAQGAQKAVLERTDTADGRTMRVQLFDGERLVSSFSVEAGVDQPTMLKNDVGAVVGSAQTLPDGTLVLFDAQGHERTRYSPQQMDRLAKKFDAVSAH